MTVSDPSQLPTVSGATLERYAGVSAAVAEGIPLSQVLEQEQIEAKDWPAI